MTAFTPSQRLWLVVERLPPHARDLNPVEQAWVSLKGTELADLSPNTIDETEEIVDESLCRIDNVIVGASYVVAASSDHHGPRKRGLQGAAAYPPLAPRPHQPHWLTRQIDFTFRTAPKLNSLLAGNRVNNIDWTTSKSSWACALRHPRQ